VGNYVSRNLADAFGGEHARDASKIHRDRNFRPPRLRVENPAYMFRGIVSQFKDEYAAVAQQVARLVNQALVHFDARGSAEERRVWFVVADFALQLGYFVARDVWRIAYD
jgi:hypothetical protein